MKSLLISTVFFSLLTISCSKKDSSVVSKKELLTSGSWKLAAVTADEDANGTYEIDKFATFSNCYKDNYYTFGNNGVLELNEGATKCNPGDTQTLSGTWQLTQNETHLMINSDEWELVELTSSTLKWKENYSGGRSSLVTFIKR
jgi:hypothetical protein